MATLKDVKTKISAVKKTQQITKAMNMVAASKLRGAQTSMEGFRPYSGKFAEVLGSLAEKAGEGLGSSPIFAFFKTWMIFSNSKASGFCSEKSRSSENRLIL